MDWLVNLLGMMLIIMIVVWFWLMQPGSKD